LERPSLVGDDSELGLARNWTGKESEFSQYTNGDMALIIANYFEQFLSVTPITKKIISAFKIATSGNKRI
jgi:hypothetical protein